MKPQELCQAYLLYQVLQGGIFSTGGRCTEEEGKGGVVARQAGGTAGSAGTGPWFQQCCCSSVGLGESQSSTGKDAAGYLLCSLLSWVPEHLFTDARAPGGVLLKGLCSSIGLLPVQILPPVPHRQSCSLFSVFPWLTHCSRLVTSTAGSWWHSRRH